MFDLLTTPGTTDIAYDWIGVLFPTNENSAFGAAFQTFTSMLGMLGGLFLGWHVIIGIVSSAYSGKVLGDRFHQIWAPLRVVIGFAMLIPLGSGFSSVHYILRDVIGKAAVNMGNAPIIAYIDHLAKNGGDVNMTSMAGTFLIREIIEREVCVIVRDAIDNVSKPQLPNSAGFTVPVVGGDSDSATRHITRWSYGSCGSFGFETVYADTGVKSADNSATSNLNVAYKAFHDKRAVATQEMIDTLRSRGFTPELQKALGEYFSKKSYSELASAGIAKSLEQGGITINAVGILMNDLGATWNSKVQQAAREIYNASASESKDALAKRIETYGFMVAGTYERELSKISGNTSRLSNAMPFTTIPNPGTSYIDAYRAAVDAIYLNRNLDSDELLAKGGADMSDGGDALSSLMNKIMPSMDVLQRKSHLSSDPVGEMISFGHTLLAFAQVLILGVLAAVSLSEGGAGNAVAAFFGAKGVAAGLQYLSQWISYFILILIVVGVLHAYILPMIPMIMVFVMGISWLVLFLEAAIAGVLWAFAFIRMDGQEFFDRHQSNGVSLLFNLFLRPAIGMLAFIGGIILLPTMLRALDLIWNDAFYAQAGSAWTFTGLFWLATNLVMYFWLQWHLTLRLFGLVPTIADRVGHWMGFSGGHGYNDGQETTAAVGAAVAAGTAVSKAPINPQVNLDAKKKRENAPPPPHEEGK